MEFESLYDRYARRLLGWASRRTRGSADADDLLQDAFLAIHLSLPTFRGESDLDAWVFGVARNVWRVQLRAAGRMKRSGIRVHVDEIVPGDLVDPRTPADALDEARALRQVASLGREQLGDAEWERLVDYSFERTDLDELELETGLSRDALKSRISRTRRRLYAACPELAS
jgi:RNA polymerase sigma-70 factor (ECF subfamily)